MTKKKSILIVGDSWGKGEMGPNFTIAHPGINLYLEEFGYQITSKAFHGGTNRLSIHMIEKYYDSNYHDYIIFLFTDPTRDYEDFIDPYWAKSEEEIRFKFAPLQPFPTQSNYKQLWLERREAVLKEILPYNEKLILIGGNNRISKFAKQLGFKYTTDWIDHIAPNNSAPEIWGTIEILNRVPRWWIEKNKEDLAKGKEQMIKTWASYDVFWPSGFHPNREGHLIISNWIHNLIQTI